MQVADFDVKDFEDDQNRNGVYARFYHVPRENKALSAESGRPVFEDREYVEIIAAGNGNNIVRRPATDMDRSRFNREYSKFREGDKEQLVGTPLSEVPWISRSHVEELLYLKVRTLEQLAELSDSVCTNTPGMFDLKRKAAKWMQKAEGASQFTSLEKENEELKARMAALEAKLSGEKEEKPAGVAKAVAKKS